jgi:DNA-binding transcriptional MerR regulator
MSAFVVRRKKTLARIEVIVTGPAGHSLKAAAALTGVRPDLLRYYCRAGLLGRERAGASDPVFDDNALYEVRRIEHVRQAYGVTRRALPLFCDLLRQVERLQDEVRFLRGP